MGLGNINIVYGLPCTYTQLMEIVCGYEWKYTKYMNLEENIQSRIHDDFTEEEWKEMEEKEKENWKWAWANDILDESNLEYEFSVELWAEKQLLTYDVPDDFEFYNKYSMEVFRFPHNDRKKPFAVVGIVVGRLKLSKGYQSTDLNLSIETMEQMQQLWAEIIRNKRFEDLAMFSIPNGCA